MAGPSGWPGIGLALKRRPVTCSRSGPGRDGAGPSGRWRPSGGWFHSSWRPSARCGCGSGASRLPFGCLFGFRDLFCFLRCMVTVRLRHRCHY